MYNPRNAQLNRDSNFMREKFSICPFRIADDLRDEFERERDLHSWQWTDMDLIY